jgi:hypothetical protein
LSLKDINDVIVWSKFNDLAIAKNNKIIPSSTYGYGKDTHTVFQLFTNGCSLIFDKLNESLPKLDFFVENLSKQIPYQKSILTNVYLTPDNSQTFNLHCDWQDVFVIQVAGSKKWDVYKPKIENPINDTQCDQYITDITNENLIYSQVLEKGDVIYIPRGFPHEVKTNEEFSLHITLTCIPYTIKDIIEFQISEKSNTIEDLRKPITGDSIDFKDIIHNIFNDKINHNFSDNFKYNPSDLNRIELNNFFINRLEIGNLDFFHSTFRKSSFANIDFLTENQVKIHSPFEKVNLENANKELKTIFEEKKTFKISDLSGHLNQTEKMQLVQFLVQNNFIYKCE